MHRLMFAVLMSAGLLGACTEEPAEDEGQTLCVGDACPEIEPMTGPECQQNADCPNAGACIGLVCRDPDASCVCLHVRRGLVAPSTCNFHGLEATRDMIDPYSAVEVPYSVTDADYSVRCVFPQEDGARCYIDSDCLGACDLPEQGAGQCYGNPNPPPEPEQSEPEPEQSEPEPEQPEPEPEQPEPDPGPGGRQMTFLGLETIDGTIELCAVRADCASGVRAQRTSGRGDSLQLDELIEADRTCTVPGDYHALERFSSMFVEFDGDLRGCTITVAQRQVLDPVYWIATVCDGPDERADCVGSSTVFSSQEAGTMSFRVPAD